MKFGTPLKSNSIKIMLLGSGELGKEVIIEAQRLGIETIAVDGGTETATGGVSCAHPRPCITSGSRFVGRNLRRPTLSSDGSRHWGPD